MINKETITLALKLFVITALSALILAFVNQITAPVIKENTVKSFNEAQAEVLPEAVEFTEVKLDNKESGIENTTIDKFCIAKDGNNNNVGYVVSTISSEGYGGDVKVMVGINSDHKITKVKILEASETPGLGAKASEPKFIDQYNNKGAELSVVKGTASKENDIVAISGATITSKAVTNAVNAATAVVEKSLRDGGSIADEESKVNAEFDDISEKTEKQMSENPDNSGLSTEENKVKGEEK